MKVNKQFQGSKKAGKRKSKIFRDMKYCTEVEKQKIINAPNSSMEEVAEAMGIRLR